jgi:hypothetical protein
VTIDFCGVQNKNSSVWAALFSVSGFLLWFQPCGNDFLLFFGDENVCAHFDLVFMKGFVSGFDKFVCANF